MRALVLGAGMMGSVIARDLAESQEISEVVVADVNPDRLQSCLKADRTGKVSVRVTDAGDRGSLVAAMRGVAVVASALLHEFSLGVLEAAIDAGVHVVDLVGSKPREKLALDARAKAAGCTLIPGLGVAPGLSNVLVGRGFRRLDDVETAVIKVGGLPQQPHPPLEYRVVYALESCLNQYVRPALIVRDGQAVEVEPMTDLELDDFPPPVGRCECFVTDGLATLPLTLARPDLRYMAEKTVRYPGHAERIRTLIECGFFDTTPTEVGGCQVSPRAVLEAVLRPRLQAGDERDVTVLRVEVSGRKGGKRMLYRFDMVDLYDEATRTTSMARTTAYPCTSACRMLIRGEITERGVLPPELLFDDRLYAVLTRDLAERGVKMQEYEILLSNQTG
ncbi:MAG: saccharopine dehydrogenase C-terminal domain-containing protein [Bacillota bacterium]|nr:saccharopine dehydrogenase C-terminal domain-containing protein [Bacillota bacterium]